MSISYEFSLGQELISTWAEGLAVGTEEQWNYVEGFV